jgi:hypothetical protein
MPNFCWVLKNKQMRVNRNGTTRYSIQALSAMAGAAMAGAA